MEDWRYVYLGAATHPFSHYRFLVRSFFMFASKLRLTPHRESEEDWEDGCSPQIIEPNLPTFPSHPILAPYSQIRTIHINASSLSAMNMKAALIPAIACAQKLPQLREIAVALPRIFYGRWDDQYDESGLVTDLVEDFSCHLGVSGRLSQVSEADEMGGEKMIWFWKL
jgi:hypothetical protein